MFSLLQKLPTSKRRLVLESKFVQQERLDLESWAVNVKRQRTSTSSEIQDLDRLPSAEFINEKDVPFDNEACSDDIPKESACLAICEIAEPDEPSPALLEDGEADSETEANTPWQDSDIDLMGICSERLRRGSEVCADCCMLNPQTTTDEDNQCSGSDATVPDVPKPEGGSVRGVACKVRRSKPYYQANVCVETLYLVAREVPELPDALDGLVVLTAMKHRILNGIGGGSSFEARVRAAVPEVLREHGLVAEDLGLGFHVMISMRFWIRPPLHTPHQQSLEAALSAWSRLSPFRMQAGESRSIARASVSDLQSRWLAFRNAYLSILEEHGKCRDQIAARLDALEDAAHSLRERRLERWNREQMSQHDRLCHRSRRAAAAARAPYLLAARLARAERQNQQAMAAEEHRQRQAEAAERRLERLNRRALAQEDLQSHAMRRAEMVEARLVRRIERLLCTWQRARRQQQRCRAAREARLVREAGRAAKRKLQAKRAAIAAAHAAARRARTKRDSLWRWLRRPDLTIGEMLSRR